MVHPSITRILWNVSTKSGISKDASMSLTKDYVLKHLRKIVELDRRYGFFGDKFENFTPERICVEYSSPNIAKEFHAGHLRSTFVGQAISNIVEAPGNKVTRINYLGDWGMQFALLAAGYKKYGDDTLLNQNPVKHLHEIYVRANQSEGKDKMLETARRIFLAMENNCPDSLDFWRYCRKISMEKLLKLYRSMHIDFDCYDSEGLYVEGTKKLISDLKSSDLVKSLSSNALGMDIGGTSWYQSAKTLSTSDVMLARGDGTTLYLSRDVSAAISRREKFQFDKMVYVTDVSQSNHFVQVYSALERLGYDWAVESADILKHVGFGRVIGMKTRTGDSIFAEHIIDEAIRCVGKDRLEHSTRRSCIENEEEVIRKLALSGLICADMKSKLSRDYKFLWSRVLDSKGDTGIFMQYTHSRLQNLKKNCGYAVNLDVDCGHLISDPIAADLFHQLLEYNDVCWAAYTDLQPSHLTNYMFKLAHAIAKAHKNCRVKIEDAPKAQSRLLLFHCAQITLRNCMITLGMQPLDNM